MEICVACRQSLQFLELLNQLPLLQKLAIEVRDAKSKAAELAKAFDVLQKYFPNAVFSTAVFNERLLADHNAHGLEHELLTRVTELLLASEPMAGPAQIRI
jgi:hypothetical protein